MKRDGGRKQATFRRWFRTVAIDICLVFNVPVVFSSTYFRFLLVKLSSQVIGLKIGEAHQTEKCAKTAHPLVACKMSINIFSSIIGAPNDLPALPIQNPNIFEHFYIRCAFSNDAGCIGAPLVLMDSK
jgi:hypothetical protein